MRSASGNLLLGGMALKNLECYIEPETGAICKTWSGRRSVSRAHRDALELGRIYRLELSDGRAGQLIVTELDVPAEEDTADDVVVEFRGTSALE